MRWPLVSRGRFDDLEARYKELKAERDKLIALFVPALGTPVAAPAEMPEHTQREEEEGHPVEFGEPRPAFQARVGTRDRAKSYQMNSRDGVLARMADEAMRDAALVVSARRNEAEEAARQEAAHGANVPAEPVKAAEEVAAEAS